jgi:hypothetical protein
LGKENNTDRYFDYNVGGIDYTFNTTDGFSTKYSDSTAPYIINTDMNTIEFYHNGMNIDNIDICKFLNKENRKNCK